MPTKPLPKPASVRTLQRKYTELASVTHGRIDTSTDPGRQLSDLLHRYFAAFSNLYGVLPLRTAWEIVRRVEPVLISQKKLLKKDFLTFTDVLRAEALPYYVLNEEDIWPDETSDNPIDRILVNKKLIGRGYYRFRDLFVLMESQGDRPYVLLNRKEYLAWADPDHFRKSVWAKDMLRFLENLRVAKDSKNHDIDGRPICGKTLNKFIFWNKDERSMYDYPSRKWEKDAIAAENNRIESEKLMQKIERNMHLADPILTTSEFLRFLLDDLEEVGVCLSAQQLDRLLQLYQNMNNKSSLWCNCGWTPEKLLDIEPHTSPPSISFGPGLQAAFANGDLDRAELERMLRERGIQVLN